MEQQYKGFAFRSLPLNGQKMKTLIYISCVIPQSKPVWVNQMIKYCLLDTRDGQYFIKINCMDSLLALSKSSDAKVLSQSHCVNHNT